MCAIFCRQSQSVSQLSIAVEADNKGKGTVEINVKCMLMIVRIGE